MSALVVIEQGECPVCGHYVEAADGLEHYKCGIGHSPALYTLVDTYAMDAAATWDDSQSPARVCVCASCMRDRENRG